jgi:hypothetical protein
MKLRTMGWIALGIYLIAMIVLSLGHVNVGRR